MVHIPAVIRSRLKKPLGRLQRDFRGVKELSRSRRIISVGDVCTLGLLAEGVTPHLAVFDHLFMRHKLEPWMKRALQLHFRKPRRYKNPAGTVSNRILADASRLISEGGAVLIDGEEDLTALAFIREASARDIVIYGQPNEGIVIVMPDRKIKKRIERWLSTAAALGHEVKGDVGEKG